MDSRRDSENNWRRRQRESQPHSFRLSSVVTLYTKTPASRRTFRSPANSLPTQSSTRSVIHPRTTFCLPPHYYFLVDQLFTTSLSHNLPCALRFGCLWADLVEAIEVGRTVARQNELGCAWTSLRQFDNFQLKSCSSPFQRFAYYL